jgi:uncharacterized protein YciI
MPKRQFQRLAIVRLCTPAQEPPESPNDDEIFKGHLAYLGSLRDQGIILLNGPVKRQDDPKFRGMSIYSVGIDEARRLASQDPGVLAGWFELVFDEWLLPSIPTMMGDRVDLELDVS